MFRLVFRQLAYSPPRTVLTATALAAVVAVILVLEGFDQGLLEQSRRLVTERRADLIVTQAGVANMHAARSILPQIARRDVEAVDGVAIAHPLTGIMAIYGEGDRRTPIYLFVHDTAGGPRQIIAGGPPAMPRDITVDRSLARKYDLEPGDPFVLSDFEFRIAGITTGDTALLTPLGFVRFDGLLDFYFESDLAADISTFPLLSFLLVELEPDADRDVVAQRIRERVPAGDVFLPERLADNDAALASVMFGPVFKLLISVAWLTGVLVAAIIMFAAVLARRRGFGVLKALGFPAAFLIRAVVAEAVVLAVIAVPAGMVLAAGIATAVEAAMPLYLVLPLQPAPVVRTALGAVAFCMLGALAPIPLIHRVDPALGFRS
jgi:predicted lysophospholipase L1 biosynthesis ABC-type transport system permease subunit